MSSVPAHVVCDGCGATSLKKPNGWLAVGGVGDWCRHCATGAIFRPEVVRALTAAGVYEEEATNGSQRTRAAAA